MKCPVCNVNLVMSERQGVEIDYCPECRGVWLDRGELDKIIDRSAPQAAPASRETERYRDDRDSHDRRSDDRRYDERRSYDKGHGYPKKKKRESFLEDLFDFG